MHPHSSGWICDLRPGLATGLRDILHADRYGIWRRIGPDRFEAKYEFYPTSAPTGLEDITKGSGWLRAGRGVFSETITVAADGATFTSTIRYEAFDEADKPVEGGGDATGRGVRLRF